MTDSISMSSISSLDITRNPFESTQDRLNFPGYSPSMFTKQETPSSERKKKSFRWDIDQISILYPAEIEEHPHQDYSSTSPYLRDEDKMRVEREAEEYFSQSSIVPSPWTPDRSLKRVTFSPLPPTTAYISACNSSGDSSYLSPNNSAVLPRAEVGSQTSLSFPIDLDLENLLGSEMYYNEQGENKDMSVSSLRRKLFAQCDLSSPAKAENSRDQLHAEEHLLKSILKSPKSPNWITSSPLSVKKKSPDVFSPSLTDGMTSPDVSPIKQPMRVKVDANNNKTPVRRSLSSMEVSYNVMESSDIEGSCALLPDLSPIKDADIKEKPNEENPSDVFSMASENDKEDCDDVEPDLKYDKEELPAVLTMNDLAESDEDDDTEKSPGLRVEELTSSEAAEQDKGVRTEIDRVCENMDIGSEEKVIENVVIQPSKTTSNSENQTELTSNDLLTKAPNSKLESKRTELSDEWCTHKSTFLQLDDELIMMKAVAALRRADRISPPYKTKSYASLYSTSNLNITSSLKTTNLSIMNTSTLPWQPVGMSTPLPTQPGRIRVYGSSYYDCDYCNSSIDKSDMLTMPFRHKATRSPFLFSGDLESGLGRSSYASNDSLYTFGQSTKKLSPVMEDIIRRKEILKAGLEEAARIRPEAPSYSSRSFIPRTHPLSNVDRRRLYGKTMFGLDLDNHMSREYKRSSWPSAGVQSVKLTQGSHPLGPPVFLPPAKYSRSEIYDPPISNHPRSEIYGRAYKLPIPAPYDGTDSGFADWKRSISRWESTTKINHNDVFSGQKQEYEQY